MKKSGFLMIFKNFLDALAVLRHLPKVKWGLGIAFGAHFLHTFPIKMFLI